MRAMRDWDYNVKAARIRREPVRHFSVFLHFKLRVIDTLYFTDFGVLSY